MKSFFKYIAVAGALCAMSAVSVAEEKATSLDQLLQLMKNSQVAF